jgi:hypothetical protein
VKAAELIRRLTVLVAKHGDQEVCMRGYYEERRGTVVKDVVHSVDIAAGLPSYEGRAQQFDLAPGLDP